MHALAKKTDYSLIGDSIEPGSRVLDLGCGDGELLFSLKTLKNIWGRGVDIDENNVIHCIEKGLSVCQRNIDEGLQDYKDQSFDYVVLNQTIQVVHKPHIVLDEMLRVGRKVIVGFPNFGYIQLPLYLFFRGRMPKSKQLPYEWYNTPNIHLLTIKDFREFCKNRSITIVDEIFIRNDKVLPRTLAIRLFENIFIEAAIFIISRESSQKS